MRTVRTIALRAACLLLLLPSCQPEAPDGPFPQRSALHLAVDSACLRVPNAFTPNGDGMNDWFTIVASHISGLHTTIIDDQGRLVHAATERFVQWKPGPQQGSGPFTVIVTATTESGQVLSGTMQLNALPYGADGCIHSTGRAVFGDQLDPRRCDTLLASHEIVCP
jgi:hypothetical protein